MNLEDQIGFVVVVNENQAIGITIESGQFIMFTYDNVKKTSTHQIIQVTNEQHINGLK